MMRHTIIGLLLFCPFTNRAQTTSTWTPEKTENTRTVSASDTTRSTDGNSDTTFIFKKVISGFYHAIYIDTSKESKEFKQLINFNFNDRERKGYVSGKKAMQRKDPTCFKQNNTFGLPENWLPLYPYDGNYYLYAPSDWGNAGKRILNDQEFIYWYMDGPFAVPLQNITQSSDLDYTLTVLNPYEKNSEPTHITIHIIDPETKMAVFEYSDQPKDQRYQLYIPVEAANHFDLIVNYCKEQKQLEYPFDTIDFEELMENR